MSFEIGDVVVLKSGGPTLTVKETGSEGVTCLWYADDEEEFRTAILPAACLIAIDGEEGDEGDKDEDEENDDEEDEEADEAKERVG